jgi:hypothetical protein
MRRITHFFTESFRPFIMVALAFFAASLLQAQSQADYDALLEMVGQEKFGALQSERPEALAELAYMNRHGYYVGNAGEKDISMYPDALNLQPEYDNVPPPTEELLDSGNWNLYGYKIYPDQKDFQYYRIGESNKLLVVLPVEMAKKRMAEAKNQ